MFIPHCVVCVFLAAFSFVVLCATDVCGEYPSGVSRKGDVDAHGPKYIYAAGERQWQMRAILQSGHDTEQPVATQEVTKRDSKSSPTDNESQSDDTKEKVKDQVKGNDGETKVQDGMTEGKVSEGSSVESKPAGSAGVSGPGNDTVEIQRTENDGKKNPDGKGPQTVLPDNREQTVPVADRLKGRRTDDASLPPAAPDPSTKQTASDGGGGASQTEIKDQNAGGQGDKNGQSTTQPAGTSETKKKENTPTSLSKKESDTETTDFAAFVRAPLVFFSLLAALACVCVC